MTALRFVRLKLNLLDFLWDFVLILIHFFSSLDRSPLYSHISTTLHGLTTIRAYSAEGRFRRLHEIYHDDHTASWFLFMAGSRWLGTRLDFMCTVFISLASFTPLFLAEAGIRKSLFTGGVLDYPKFYIVVLSQS